jgi:hypothetical protein
MSDSPRSAAEREADEFHMMLGYCIAVWADVDDLLFQVFRECVGPPLQCAIIYYKTPGLDARFSLTDEIVRSILPKKKPGGHDHPSVIAWDKAIKPRQDLLAIRRRLAHHPVTIRMRPHSNSMLNRAPPGKMTIGGPIHQFSWTELYATEQEKLRGRTADLMPLRLPDLENHFNGVGALANNLLGFLIWVISKPNAELSLPGRSRPPEKNRKGS